MSEDPEWADKCEGSGWVAATGWGCVGAMLLWLFLTLVLGWPQP
jgi:hypothetical protein